MNSRSRIVYSLAVGLLLTGCGAVRERRTAHIQRTWPAGAIRRVEVHEVAGSIEVTGSTTDRIDLSADIMARREPNRNKENDGYFTAEVIGDTLVIDTERRHRRVIIGFWNNDDVKVDYELHVPRDVSLELRTVSGHIATRAIAGETSATTINGVVDLEATGQNEVEAKAVNGTIEAHFLTDFHGARLGTVNGRVTATLPSTASFLGEFAQVNGDFEAAFPLNIHSHPGSRRVSGEVNGGRYSLKITTVNGDIKIDNGPTPPAPPVVPETPAPPAKPATSATPAPRT